jgi:O-antigen/teichoic acid export membrane protein
LSNIKDKKHIKVFQRISNLALLLNVGITLMIVLPIMFIPQHIMSLFGNGFIEGASVLMMICICTVIQVGTRILFIECISLNRAWDNFIAGLIPGIICIILLYYLLQLGYGAFGMAITYTIFYLLGFVYLWRVLTLYKNKNDFILRVK